MSVINEINSLKDFVSTKYPSTIIHRQDVPAEPTANSFVIRIQDVANETETRFTTVSPREFQVIYFGSSSVDVLTKADVIAKAFMNDKIAIPIKDSLRFMRVESFSYGMPFKTESGVDAVIGVLQTVTREARDLQTYEKIMSVSATVTGG